MKFWVAEFHISHDDDYWVIGYYDTFETALWDVYERPMHPTFDSTLHDHTWELLERTGDHALLRDEVDDTVEIYPITPASRQHLEEHYAAGEARPTIPTGG